MSVELPVLLGELAPGFQRFLVLLALLGVASIVLAIVGLRARPATAQRARKINSYILLSILALIILFPMYMTVVNSLLQSDQIVARPPKLFPTDPQWSSYADAWTDGELSSYLFNSVVVTFLIVAGQLVTSVFAGYAFAFLEFPLRRTIFVIFLTTMMIPFEVVFFTNLQTVTTLGDVPGIGSYIGFDTYGALAIPFLATGFGAFLVRQAFLSLPRDLRDAAELDGYGHFPFMWRVAVPLARPTIAALALFSFFGAWNQYLWPLVATENTRTVQVGLRQLLNTELDQFNVTFAGTVLAALPLFILLLIFQKQLVRGLTTGAVKG
jgi:sn-glycerol 3-phosphate transport system permease protein